MHWWACGDLTLTDPPDLTQQPVDLLGRYDHRLPGDIYAHFADHEWFPVDTTRWNGDVYFGRRPGSTAETWTSVRVVDDDHLASWGGCYLQRNDPDGTTAAELRLMPGLRADSQIIELVPSHPRCNGPSAADAVYEPQVLETDERIEIVVLVAADTNPPCGGDATSVTIELEQPLGERVVTNAGWFPQRSIRTPELVKVHDVGRPSDRPPANAEGLVSLPFLWVSLPTDSDDRLDLEVARCADERLLAPDVEYRADSVRVTIRARQRSPLCDTSALTGLTVYLDEPLGGRMLVDGARGSDAGVRRLEPPPVSTVLPTPSTAKGPISVTTATLLLGNASLAHCSAVTFLFEGTNWRSTTVVVPNEFDGLRHLVGASALHGREWLRFTNVHSFSSFVATHDGIVVAVVPVSADSEQVYFEAARGCVGLPDGWVGTADIEARGLDLYPAPRQGS